MSDIWWIIWLSAGLTYVTRFAGHLLLARVERIPPRLEAALNAVPAAVITTIVALRGAGARCRILTKADSKTGASRRPQSILPRLQIDQTDWIADRSQAPRP